MGPQTFSDKGQIIDILHFFASEKGKIKNNMDNEKIDFHQVFLRQNSNMVMEIDHKFL